jgi:trk system potassium uptake protein TrkA
MFVVIVGAGRFGGLAAKALSEKGVSVTIIDQSQEILDALPESFSGFRLEGDAAELETLKRSRMDEADVVLAVTESDSLNLLVAQVARDLFGVTHVVARIFDPETEEVYKHLDVTILCPTTLGLNNLLSDLMRDRKQPERSAQDKDG